MDPLSHALIGGLIGQSAGVSKKRFWIMSFLGIFPDVDIVGSFLGGWAFMFQHRGITHSLLGLVIQPLFFCIVLAKWDSGLFWKRWVHYFLPIAAHLLADSLTAFGIPLWAPFSFKEYSLNFLGSVNLIPLIILAIGLLWLYKKNRQGWVGTRLIWGFLIVYLSISISEKAWASVLVHDSSTVTLPTTIQSLTWRAIQSDDIHHQYRTFSVNLLRGTEENIRNISMPAEELPVIASRSSALVQKFIRENRWPVVRVVRKKDGWTVDWGTLLYSTRGLVRGKVRVDVSEAGVIQSEQKIFTFWDPEFIS